MHNNILQNENYALVLICQLFLNIKTQNMKKLFFPIVFAFTLYSTSCSPGSEVPAFTAAEIAQIDAAATTAAFQSYNLQYADNMDIIMLSIASAGEGSLASINAGLNRNIRSLAALSSDGFLPSQFELDHNPFENYGILHNKELKLIEARGAEVFVNFLD